MKLNYIVSRIEASQDGSPYVFVTYANPNDFKVGGESPITIYNSHEKGYKCCPQAMRKLRRTTIGSILGNKFDTILGPRLR